MSLNRIFDIAGTGMSAQSVRLNTTASNLANAETASSSIDQTYKARKPVFAAVQQSALEAQAGIRGAGFESTPASLGVQVKG
ncbi:MAG: flagellar basal body protein, partial [Gammaproteobacteria bacterium]|nr:flagellar basal body protein [Gammaproteobacteria bacterium]